MNATLKSIRLAQCHGEAIHAVSQLGSLADSASLSAITELSAKHLLAAVELLVNRLVKSQVVELIRLASHAVDNDQAGTLLRARLASNQTETQENIASQIAGIHGTLVQTRAVIDQTLDKVKPYLDLLHVPDTCLRKGLETILDLTSPSDGVPTSELLLKTILQRFLAAQSTVLRSLVFSNSNIEEGAVRGTGHR
jgi:hypothetical protein